MLDWIEELFGLSPDGGSGATEMLIVTAIVLAVVAIGVGFAQRRRA